MADTTSSRVNAKKASKPRTTAEHPSPKEMIKAAISALKERNGSSRAALKKYIETEFKYDIETKARFIIAALKKGVADGTFVQVKNSFKLSAEAKKEPKKKPVEKKPAAKKEKKAKTSSDAKKTAGAGKDKKTGDKKKSKTLKKAKKSVEKTSGKKPTKKPSTKSKPAAKKTTKAKKA